MGQCQPDHFQKNKVNQYGELTQKAMSYMNMHVLNVIGDSNDVENLKPMVENYKIQNMRLIASSHPKHCCRL